MKKIRTDFESQLWADRKKYSGVQLMEIFFQLNSPAVSKAKLSNIMNYAVNRNRCIKEDPSTILHFGQCMQSFIRAGYLIALKDRKWALSSAPGPASPLVLGLLSEEEYQNPLLVFRKAFEEYRIKEFNYFMSGIIYFSLGIYDHVPERNIVNPYIHLIKMMDAAHLILERRGKK